jgi:SAM-dependent methyltransferase
MVESNATKKEAPVPTLACPFGHSSAYVLEKLPIADLAQAWRREFGISIQSLFARLERDELEFCECQECNLRFFSPGVPGDGSFYSALSHWYDQWRGHVAGAEFKPDYLVAQRHIEPGSAVLEIGCGCARFDLRIPEGCSYVGLELNPDYVLRGRAAGVDVRLEPVQTHAGVHPGEYDVVCLFQVIEHIADVHAFIAACLDCVRPGGLLIVGCPNTEGFLRTEHDNLLNMPPHHITWWSRRSLEFLAQELGLMVAEIVEEPLENESRRGFMQSFWMNRLLRPAAGQQFVLTGARYRLSRFGARVLSRLTSSWIVGFENCIKGHTITAVYRKPLGGRGDVEHSARKALSVRPNHQLGPVE